MPHAPLKRPDLLVGSIVIVVLMGTALVSPLYPVYREVWGLSASEVTQLYVAYMLGALCGLLVFGRLPDQIGTRKVLGLALLLGLIGTLLSMAAQGFMLFCLARFLVGVAGSMTTAAGSLALIKLAAEGRRAAAPALASVVISVGFGLGPVVGGVIGQWAPAPLLSAHLPSLLMTLACLALVPRLPADRGRGGFGAASLLPRLAWTTRERSLRFGFACALPFLGFGIFGLYASLGPMLVRNFTGLEGPILSGAYIGLFLTGTALAQFFGRRMAPNKAVLAALLLMAAGNAVMWINLSASTLPLFVIWVCFAAVGHGFCLLSSTLIVNSVAGPENGGALTATYWAIGYSGAIVPLLLLGWASDHWGMEAAVSGFCALAITLCLAVAGLFVLTRGGVAKG